MHKIVMILMLFMFTGSASSHPDQTDQEECYVEKVFDGDTIKVRLLHSDKKLTVRILGINCPEVHKNKECERDKKWSHCWDGLNWKCRNYNPSRLIGHGCNWQISRGLKAVKRATELLKHKKIALECDGKCKKGTFERELRYVRLEDGRDFGQVMIRYGLCEDFSWKYPHPRTKTYFEAQAKAMKDRQGIWWQPMIAKGSPTIQDRIIAEAEKYLGKMYVFGGRNGRRGCLQGDKRVRCSGGIDCQSLIFFAYEKVLETRWTRFSVMPSICIRKNQLGRPVKGLDGVLADELDQGRLRKGDVLFFLLKDYNLDADQPLLVRGKDRYGVWHTGMVHGHRENRVQVIHAKPGYKVLIEPIDDIGFDAIFVVRLQHSRDR